MSLITPSIADFLGTRLDRFSRGRDDHPHLVAEIPPGMLKHLRNEGVVHVLSYPVWMVGAIAVVSALLDALDWSPMQYTAAGVAIQFGVFGLGSLLFAKLHLRLPLKRELAYRLRHGKWRWDR